MALNNNKIIPGRYYCNCNCAILLLITYSTLLPGSVRVYARKKNQKGPILHTIVGLQQLIDTYV